MDSIRFLGKNTVFSDSISYTRWFRGTLFPKHRPEGVNFGTAAPLTITVQCEAVVYAVGPVVTFLYVHRLVFAGVCCYSNAWQ